MHGRQRIIAAWSYVCICVVLLLFTSTHTNSLDITHTDATVTNFHEIETRTVAPLSFRWGANDATLQLPYSSSGPQILKFFATTPQPSHITLRINGNGIGTYTIQPGQFRTYWILSTIPWQAQYAQTTLVFHSDNPSLVRREIAIGLTEVTLYPLSPITLPAAIIWLLLFYTVVLTYGWRLSRRQLIGYYVASCSYIVLLTNFGLTSPWWIYAYIVGFGSVVALLQAPTPTPPVVTAHTSYRRDIDGLRALAVMAVVGYHAFPALLHGGYVGVDVFFVISGYLISQILLRQIATNSFTFRDFYSRRIRRIFPALSVLFGAILVFGAICLVPAEYQDLGRAVGAGAGFFANLQLYHDIGYFDTQSIYKPLLHLWSLGIEEQFYVVWPVLLLLFRRRFTAIPGVLIALTGMSFITNIMLSNTTPDAAFYWPISRFWELAIGGLLAYTTVMPPKSPLPTQTVRTLQSLVGAVVVIGSMYAYTDQLAYPSYWALLPVIGTYLLLQAGEDAWFNRVVLSQKILVWIGLISFPLYLWHWSLLSFAYILLSSIRLPLLVSSSIVVASVVLAAGTYWYIEKPLRVGRYRTIPTFLIALCTFAIGGIGYGLIGSGIIAPYNRTIAISDNTAAAPITHTPLPHSRCEAVSLSPIATCWSNTPNDSRGTEYYFVGDSHAEALASDAISYGTPHHLTYYSVYGCLPFLGIERYTGDATEAFGCANPQGLASLLQTLANQQTTNHRVVVLVSRYSFMEPDVADTPLSKQVYFQFAGPRQPSDRINRDDVFRQGLRNTLDRLTTLPNTTVVFMHQVPELNFAPQSCNRWQIVHPNQRECTIARQTVDTYFARYKANAATVLSDYPTVIQYDPMTQMCDATVCTVIHEAISWYHDTNHVSPAGAKIITTELWKRFP